MKQKNWFEQNKKIILAGSVALFLIGIFIYLNPSVDKSNEKNIENTVETDISHGKKSRDDIEIKQKDNGIVNYGTMNIGTKEKTEESSSSSVHIKGKVVNEKNIEEVIPNAIIHFVDYKISRGYSNMYGDFEIISNIKVDTKNKAEIEISAIGYKTKTIYKDIDDQIFW